MAAANEMVEADEMAAAHEKTKDGKKRSTFAADTITTKKTNRKRENMQKWYLPRDKHANVRTW
jgi:hypothetical protein